MPTLGSDMSYSSTLVRVGGMFCAGKPTGAFAREMKTAIGSAPDLADKEARASDLDVTVWLSLKGKQRRFGQPDMKKSAAAHCYLRMALS
jgi:hypothetical protein